MAKKRKSGIRSAAQVQAQKKAAEASAKKRAHARQAASQRNLQDLRGALIGPKPHTRKKPRKANVAPHPGLGKNPPKSLQGSSPHDFAGLRIRLYRG